MIDPTTLTEGLGLKTSGIVPPQLEGQWRLRPPVGAKSTGFQIQSGGRHFIALRPQAFALTNSDSTLTIDGASYTRLWGANGIVGFWEPDAGGAGLIVKAEGDGTFFRDDQTQESFIYYIDSNEIQFWPLRSIVDTNSGTMSFFPVYRTVNGDLQFSITGDVFTWTMPDNSTLVYDREAPGFQS